MIDVDIIDDDDYDVGAKKAYLTFRAEPPQF